MDKQSLIRDMKSAFGSAFITRQQLSQYMGIKNPKNVDQYSKGLEKVNGKFYFIPDVAGVLKERCTV